MAADIPDTAEVIRHPDGWYGSNQVVHMLDFLQWQWQWQGEVAVVGREGRRRRWDFAERVYPQNLPEYEFDEAEDSRVVFLSPYDGMLFDRPRLRVVVQAW